VRAGTAANAQLRTSDLVCYGASTGILATMHSGMFLAVAEAVSVILGAGLNRGMTTASKSPILVRPSLKGVMATDVRQASALYHPVMASRGSTIVRTCKFATALALTAARSQSRLGYAAAELEHNRASDL
jgi:hypothetical protein